MSSLERQSYGEVEGKVAVEVVVKDGVVVAACVGWVDGFHSGIEADDEEVGVHAETDAVTNCDFFPEGVEVELTSRLVFVFADSPDVARIDESGSAEFPEEFGSVFETEVELDVT